jgi:hypothetical protein
MKLGEILDQGFSLYRRNFWVFAGIAFVPSAIVFALHVIDLTWLHLPHLSDGNQSGDKSLIALLVWVIYFYLSAFIFLLFYPAFVKAASDILFEEKVSLLGSLRFAAARWRRYLWIDFLKLAGQFVIPDGLGVGIIALGAYFIRRFSLNDSYVLVAFILIAPTVVVLFVTIRLGVNLAFTIPAAVLEEIGGFKALRRSWRLSTGGRMRVAVSWTLIAACTGLLWSTLQFIVRVVEEVLYRIALMHIGRQNVYAMSYYSLNTIFDAAFAPLYPIMLLLLYYDQRVRKEGYDIERMIEAAGLSAPVLEPAGESVVAPAVAEAAVRMAGDPDPQPTGEGLA